MSQHLTRKEIKRNEFAEAVEKTVHYAESHRGPLVQGIVAVLVVLVLVGLFFAYRSHRAAKAAEDLSLAILVYDAPLDATAPKPDDPHQPSFRDEASRRAKARERFEDVRSRYGSTRAGAVATSYLGRIAAEQGDQAQARKLWQEVAGGSADPMLASEVHLSLLKLDLAEGKKDEVAKSLEAMLEKGEKPMPEDMILYELASVREQLGRTDEALSAYQRILDEFPRSPYGSEAQQRVSILSAGKSLT
jgi:tetratricopeptide (TPR) repeat protein